MENDLLQLFLYGFSAGLGLFALVWFVGFCIGRVIAFFKALSK
jgi:flagellar biosynthesis protein FliQ